MTDLDELRVECPRRFPHQPTMCPCAGDQAAKCPALLALFAIRRRTPAMALRIVVAGRRAGALAIAAAGTFGNKIVRRFYIVFAHPCPWPTPRSAQMRCRDDGGDWVREKVRVHAPFIGIISGMGIVSKKYIP